MIFICGIVMRVKLDYMVKVFGILFGTWWVMYKYFLIFSLV